MWSHKKEQGTHLFSSVFMAYARMVALEQGMNIHQSILEGELYQILQFKMLL